MMAENNRQRRSRLPHTNRSKQPEAGKKRKSQLKSTARQIAKSTQRSERHILTALMLLAVFWLFLIVAHMWKVQVQGDIPERYTDEWASDKVKLLVDHGCLYVDVMAKRPWIKLDGVYQGEISYCQSLSFVPDTTITDKKQRKKNYCRNYTDLAANKNEATVARLYCSEHSFLRQLNANIVNQRYHSLRTGAPVRPIYFHSETVTQEVRDQKIKTPLTNDKQWYFRKTLLSTVEAEKFEKIKHEVNQFWFDQRFRLRGAKKYAATRQQLINWLENRQVIPPLVFANPFFVNDPAKVERQRYVRRGFLLDRYHKPLAVNQLAGEDAPVKRLHEFGVGFYSLLGSYDFGSGYGLESSLLSLLDPNNTRSELCKTHNDTSQRGCDVVLTVDKVLTETVYQSLQQLVTTEPANPAVDKFRDAWSAADEESRQQLVVVLLDAQSGEVLVSTHYPDLPQQSKHTALSEHVFPGSTFKPLTAIAAMQAGVLQPGQRNAIPITTRWKAAKCMTKGVKQGKVKTSPLPLKKALVASQNQYFARVADQVDALGENHFAAMLSESFAFDSLFFDNAEGRLPKIRLAANKLEIDQYCPPRSTALAGFGQGDVRVTPMFMAYSALAIANGGEPPEGPSLIKALGRMQTVTDERGQAYPQWTEFYSHQITKVRRFSQDAATDLTALMCQVAEVGSAKKGFSSKKPASFPVRVAIKTGTAEYDPTEKRGRHDLSVIGFYPTEQPKVAFYIGMRSIRPKDERSFLSGEVLVPVAAEVIRDTLAPLNIQAEAGMPCPSRFIAGN